MAFQNHYIMYQYIQIVITIIIETTSESLKTFSKSAYFRWSIKKKPLVPKYLLKVIFIYM